MSSSSSEGSKALTFAAVAGAMLAAFGTAATVEKLKTAEFSFEQKMALFTSGITTVALLSTIVLSIRRR